MLGACDLQLSCRVLSRNDELGSICTGPQGAVSIVRLSGPEALQIAQHTFQPSGKKRTPGWQPDSHRVYHGMLRDTAGRAIDEVRSACCAMLCMHTNGMEGPQLDAASTEMPTSLIW